MDSSLGSSLDSSVDSGFDLLVGFEVTGVILEGFDEDDSDAGKCEFNGLLR